MGNTSFDHPTKTKTKNEHWGTVCITNALNWRCMITSIEFHPPPQKKKKKLCAKKPIGGYYVLEASSRHEQYGKATIIVQ